MVGPLRTVDQMHQQWKQRPPDPTGAALLGCFIHSRMQGTIYVADSPWTVKTGADGVAVLDDVPEGVALLHRLLAECDVVVDITDKTIEWGGKTQQVGVTVPGRAGRPPYG